MIPEGWRKAKIREVAKIDVGRDLVEERFSRTRTDTHRFPIYSNTVEQHDHYGFYDFPEYSVESVTVVGRGIGLGTAFARKTPFGAIGRLLVLSPRHDSFDVGYLADYLNHGFEIHYESGGIPQLPGKTLGNYSILLPSLPEQRRISEILGAWDRAIETVEALIGNARAQKKALMQQLLPQVTTLPKKRLPGFSGEWREGKLGSLADISKGEQKGRVGLADEGPVPVINGGITPSGYTDHPNTAANTITISEGGNSCGHVDLITQPFWCGGHCYALKNLKVDQDYLFAVLKHRQREIMSLRVGSGLPNIQKKALSQFSIPVPPKQEQVKIGELASSADREIAANEAQLTALRQEKAALMQQLLTGQRRVKLDRQEAA